MTPFEIHSAGRAAHTGRMPIAPRTPAAWRAYAHMRRAWLIADEFAGRQRPHMRRARQQSTVHS
ncbi:hypothetical protein [Caballeronia insecticola]|uniref:Uncharacterized protein n=1 Tax=Caballeronia insecticola TaxID=758793 RepID=R4WUU0_9BURK|nr:hypothetical protein [Caballeronia insecticola]BAN24735.1 hypothetical protein BRPE64_BCDS00740 [Caballeronia insecticola]